MKLSDPPFTDTLAASNALIERLDAAVAIGTVGLAILVLLAAILAVRALW